MTNSLRKIATSFTHKHFEKDIRYIKNQAI